MEDVLNTIVHKFEVGLDRKLNQFHFNRALICALTVLNVCLSILAKRQIHIGAVELLSKLQLTQALVVVL